MNLDELKQLFETAKEVSLESDELSERSEARTETGFKELRREFENADEMPIDRMGSPPRLLSSGPLEPQNSNTEPDHGIQPIETQPREAKRVRPQPSRPQPGKQYAMLKAIIATLVLGCGLSCCALFTISRGSQLIQAGRPEVTTWPNYTPTLSPTLPRLSERLDTEASAPVTAEPTARGQAPGATPASRSQAQDNPNPIATPAPGATPTPTATSKQRCPGVQFKHGICLISGELAKLAYLPGETISGSLTWTTDRYVPIGYTVFVHLTPLDSTAPFAQHDGLPANGTRPTTTWQPGEKIHDPHQLVLPSSIAPGKYLFRVGMYEGGYGPRLSVIDAGDAAVADDAVILGSIWVN